MAATAHREHRSYRAVLWPPGGPVAHRLWISRRSGRQRANGAVIPHSRGTQYNLVLVLKPAGMKGTARSVDVFYRAAGQEYHLQTTTRIEVLAGAACT